MSVLTQGLAMDWERQGLRDMAITSLWPAVVGRLPAVGSFCSLAARMRHDAGDRVGGDGRYGAPEPRRGAGPAQGHHLRGCGAGGATRAGG